MKPAGSRIRGGQESINILGTDPLTTILVWLAFFLAAAIAALSVDLWLWPANESPVVHVSASTEPARLATASPVDPTPAPSPSPAPAPTPAPAAVRVRIPAIGVDRSIIEVPLAYDPRSKAWKRDYDLLFRQGRTDLVGHYGGSASPGEPGNTILVGHNYGYGVNGVFLRLGRLQVGEQVEVVNATGQTFTYRVTKVTGVRWANEDRQDLLEHQVYLSAGGLERLTLVTCGGSYWAPFPERVYVVADPVH